MRAYRLFALIVLSAVIGCMGKDEGGGDSSPLDVSEFTAIGYYKSILLSWSRAEGHGPAVVSIYRSVEGNPVNPGDGLCVYEGSAGDHTDTELGPGTAYYYTIFVTDGEGAFSSGVSASATVVGDPPEVTGLSVTSRAGSLEIRWEGSPDADGYRVYSTDEEGSSPVPAVCGPGTASYLLSGLINGMEYRVRVTSFIRLYDFTEIESTGIEAKQAPALFLKGVDLLTSGDSSGPEDPHTEASWHMHLKGMEISWRSLLCGLPAGDDHELWLGPGRLLSVTVPDESSGKIRVLTNTPLDAGDVTVTGVIRGNDGSRREAEQEMSIPLLETNSLYYVRESAWSGEWSDFPHKSLSVPNGSEIEIFNMETGRLYARLDSGNGAFSGHALVPAGFHRGILTLNAAGAPLCWECGFPQDTLYRVSGEEITTAGPVTAIATKGDE